MWQKFGDVVVSQVKHELVIFSSFGSIAEGVKHYLKDCCHCHIRVDNWMCRVHGHMWEDKPMFTSFL